MQPLSIGFYEKKKPKQQNILCLKAFNGITPFW